MPAATAQCPFHRHAAGPRKLTTPPPLAVQGGTHVVTPATVELGKDIGGVDALRVLCTRFYAHAFEVTVWGLTLHHPALPFISFAQ